MKKLLILLVVSILFISILSCGGKKYGITDIVIMVPSADHGWTGAVMTYAEEKSSEVNDGGKYSSRVITSQGGMDQIAQVKDLIANKTAKSIVILPHDNTLENTMRKLADSGIQFVMFDRIIDTVASDAVSSVKGDNEGIGKATAQRFLRAGMKPGDKILIMPGDNSSVPEMRNKGFFAVLKANGWTDAQIKNIKSTAYTGWSRSEGKKLFTEWMDTSTPDEIKEFKFIFTHDDEIAMGILEALKGSDIDSTKKSAFFETKVNIGTSSGLNEMYSVLKGIHQKDYIMEVSQLGDLFSVTYDPAMIQIAIQDMVDFHDGKTMDLNHTVAVDVIDKVNVDKYKGFGNAISK